MIRRNGYPACPHEESIVRETTTRPAEPGEELSIDVSRSH